MKIDLIVGQNPSWKDLYAGNCDLIAFGSDR
jgi:hypothetical protein